MGIGVSLRLVTALALEWFLATLPRRGVLVSSAWTLLLRSVCWVLSFGMERKVGWGMVYNT